MHDLRLIDAQEGGQDALLLYDSAGRVADKTAPTTIRSSQAYGPVAIPDLIRQTLARKGCQRLVQSNCGIIRRLRRLTGPDHPVGDAAQQLVPELRRRRSA
jgi:hypothetical protein